jgi:1-acyl-sn-glycerol-3-phosphate acyltransferase
MIVSLVVLVTILVLGIPAALVFIPLAVITGNVWPLYRAVRFIVQAAMRVGGIHVELERFENIPANRACIFMANHISNLDAPALISQLPGRTSAFTKRSVFKLPVFGYCLKLAGFIPTDRDGNVENAQHSVTEAQSVLARNIHITTFVEGTRSSDGRMLPFKKGPFYLAKTSGAPCVPVSIYGTEKIIPHGSMRIHPGTVHIIFHPPVDPAHYATRDELSDAVRAAIVSGLPAWMQN